MISRGWAGKAVASPPLGDDSNDRQFESFVRANATSLLRTALLLTGNHHDAEELLQDTVTHLYPKWNRVASADAPLGYVRRSLTNRFLNSRSARHRDLTMWELPEGWDGQDLGQTVTRHLFIWQMLGGLNRRQRAAIVLRYYHDLSDEQIAESLECAPATVRSLISRGLAAMRADQLADNPQINETGTTR
jgi:RNA polymerase sigma-70 factor (sigma-E family)